MVMRVLLTTALATIDAFRTLAKAPDRCHHQRAAIPDRCLLVAGFARKVKALFRFGLATTAGRHLGLIL
uniref:Putative secreted peptide n=1 Tax=Anopheles braziliensis TaxID=58242 RepID=A0A2M3ZV00_9DIPT